MKQNKKQLSQFHIPLPSKEQFDNSKILTIIINLLGKYQISVTQDVNEEMK